MLTQFKIQNVKWKIKAKLVQNTIFLFLILTFSYLNTGCVTLSEKAFFFAEKYESLPLKAKELSKEISFTTDDGTVLKGIKVSSAESNNYLLYFYGNMESIKESEKRLYALSSQHKLNVICFDYRGYGKSGGTLTMKNLKSDALEIYKAVTKTYSPDKIYIFSQSLGTVPCTTIGAAHQLDGIIMEAAFTNAEEAVSHMTDGLIWPFNEIITLQADEDLMSLNGQPIDLIKKFESPLLSIHGTKDNCFPYWIGEKLHKASGSKEKYFCKLEGISHDNVNILEGKAADYITDFLLKY